MSYWVCRISSSFCADFFIISLFYHFIILEVNISYFSSNFGVKLVMASNGRVVTADKVLPAGPQPAPMMETTIITLMHLGLHSEKMELEVLYVLFPSSFTYCFIIWSTGMNIWPTKMEWHKPLILYIFMYCLNLGAVCM